MSSGRAVRAAMAALAVAAACVAGGCATGGSAADGDAVRVHITDDSRAECGGRTVPFAELPGLVRSRGAKAYTRIEVELPTGAEQALMNRTVAVLSRAGFRKIVFITARKASAYAKGQGEAAPGEAAPAVPPRPEPEGRPRPAKPE